jgi:hypothetical protein
MKWEVEEPFGPEYPDLGATVAKFRAKARRGAPYNPAYADAIEKAILAKQRAQLGIGLPAKNPKCNCASGTSYNDGRDIHAAIQRQQAAALAACPGQVRRARTPAQWQALYAEAMAEKRERQQPKRRAA